MNMKILRLIGLPSSSSSSSSSILCLFCVILLSLEAELTLSQEQKQEQEQTQELYKNKTLTKINSTTTIEGEEIVWNPLAVLGEPEWTRLRPGWSLTVNDQCLYEFIFQFEHSASLPIGDDEYRGKCEYTSVFNGKGGGDDERIDTKIAPEDGQPYLKPRQMWEEFPDYIWATMGFNHLSVDFLPCGHRPKGYTTPQYDFSFFRVTPEYRAQTMVCELNEPETVPGEKICKSKQEEYGPNGMNFFIVPAAMIDRNPVVNTPNNFERPKKGGYGPVEHYGLRSWDQNSVPDSPKEWNDVPIFMSSYNGNTVMWQAHVPYKMVSGDESQFHSGAARYFETTVENLPDTWAVDYDEKSGLIQFTMVGKAGICEGDYKRARDAAGGSPVFPNYDDLEAERARQKDMVNGTGTVGDDGDGDDEGDVIPSAATLTSFTHGISIATIQILLFLYMGY